jgi:hypothetical protein
MRPAREERRLIVGVVLEDYHRMPEYAGYDFSDGTVLPYNDEYADMYLDNINDELCMRVREGDTDIQDMGRTNSLSEVTIAPVSGWSAKHDVRLQTGHTYVVWTWDDGCVKFRVSRLSPHQAEFDWIYLLSKSDLQSHNSIREIAPQQLSSQSKFGR